MFSDGPDISGQRKSRLLQFSLHIKVIVFCITVAAHQIIQLRRVKAGQRYIKVRGLQIGDQQGQLVLVPITIYLVESNIEGFLLLLVEVDDHYFGFFYTLGLQNFKSLMSSTDSTGSFVPDDGIDITKLIDGAFEFFIFWITRLQIFSRVIVSRDKLLQFFRFDNQERTSYPFFRSNSSITLSCGVFPLQDSVQFSFTTWKI